MSSGPEKPARVPPRWFIRSAWAFHRGLYRLTGGRFGLWRPRTKGWGTMHLTTIGRRSGTERGVILGYFEDHDRYVTLAMNGWADPDPAWWLNLQAHPEARLVVADHSTRCVVTPPRQVSASASGLGGRSWTRASTSLPADDHAKRPSSSSNRSTQPEDIGTVEVASDPAVGEHHGDAAVGAAIRPDHSPGFGDDHGQRCNVPPGACGHRHFVVPAHDAHRLPRCIEP